MAADGGRTAQLSAWDAGSLVVGIVIGTTIFRAPGFIASQTSSPMQLAALWMLGGGLAFVGALCYAELGATYAGAGGDYYYLTRAFGPWAGFLFGWTQLVVVQTVNIATFAFVFAEYAWGLFRDQSHPATPTELALTAASVVMVLTAINLAGLRSGQRTQNVLTAAKIGGIALLIFAGMATVMQPGTASIPDQEIQISGNWTVALLLILYAYGGWNDAAYVVTEVRDRRRNVPRALLGGVGFITLAYLAINAAYVMVLGFAGLQHSSQPPVDLMARWSGDAASRVIGVLVMISVLGAVNGLILSVSRVHAAVGQDHRFFAWLSRWSNRHSAPVGALVVQAMLTIALLGLVGTPAGRNVLDRCFEVLTGQLLPWERFGGGFDLLFAVGAPIFWIFFMATGFALIVLRWRDPHIERPFETPGYPVTPLIFLAMCGFGVYASVRFAGLFTGLGLAAAAAGGMVYGLERLMFRRSMASK